MENKRANNVKDTNPKDAVGTKKVPFSTVSAPVIAEIGLAMLEGARKYGRHNYRAVGVRASVYYDAMLRHLTSWWEGEDIDVDSGLSHIVKALACMVVLRDSMLMENWVDDRPPKVKQGWVQKLNEKAKEIIEQYPNALDPYVALKETEVEESQKDNLKRLLDKSLTEIVELKKKIKKLETELECERIN